jgi:hypothetical protein
LLVLGDVQPNLGPKRQRVGSDEVGGAEKLDGLLQPRILGALASGKQGIRGDRGFAAPLATSHGMSAIAGNARRGRFPVGAIELAVKKFLPLVDGRLNLPWRGGACRRGREDER